MAGIGMFKKNGDFEFGPYGLQLLEPKVWRKQDGKVILTTEYGSAAHRIHSATFSPSRKYMSNKLPEDVNIQTG